MVHECCCCEAGLTSGTLCRRCWGGCARCVGAAVVVRWLALLRAGSRLTITTVRPSRPRCGRSPQCSGCLPRRCVRAVLALRPAGWVLLLRWIPWCRSFLPLVRRRPTIQAIFVAAFTFFGLCFDEAVVGLRACPGWLWADLSDVCKEH